MEDLGFLEMQAIQKELQEKYKDQWEPLGPETGKNKLLWLMIELGEARRYHQKRGKRAISENPDTRRHFTEDVMRRHDVILTT